jgi:TDG/mug DNA glycosylase family protein
VSRNRKPTKAELAAAAGRTVADVIGYDLNVLFCGINPGLYSAATGHHFARPGNRFWRALHESGVTDRLLSPYEEQELLVYGCGITNLVERATATAAELTSEELVAGGLRLAMKAVTFRPRVIAILGISAYRTAFGQPRATIGPQAGGLHPAALWVLPNPSGLNAHYTPAGLARVFGEFRRALIEDS